MAAAPPLSVCIVAGRIGKKKSAPRAAFFFGGSAEPHASRDGLDDALPKLRLRLERFEVDVARVQNEDGLLVRLVLG